MSCLTVKVFSRTVPKFLPRYECKREIKFLRNLFKRSKAIRIPSDINFEDYKVFYYFPQISNFSLQIRLKYAKCGLILSSCLPLLYLQYKDEINIAYLIGFVSIASLYLLVAFYLAHIGKNLIGKMYLHKNMNDVLVSYINKNGRRVNKIYGIKDVEAIDHPNILYRKFFKRVVIHKSNQELNLCTFKTIKVNPFIYDTVFPQL